MFSVRPLLRKNAFPGFLSSWLPHRLRLCAFVSLLFNSELDVQCSKFDVRLFLPRSAAPIPTAIKLKTSGSGTVVNANPQLTSVLSFPPETSAKNSVQGPFGSNPLNTLRVLL